MRKRWVLPVAAFLVLVGVCGGCLWSAFERPRFTHHFDIGGGRTLTVWSIRRDVLLNFDTDPNPLMVYYRVDVGGREVIHTTFLDHDDKGEYQFRVVSADGGRLVGVYEVSRAADNHYMMLMYDADSGESWPRVRDDETTGMPAVVAKWRERHGRLLAAHPEFPSPEPFR